MCKRRLGGVVSGCLRGPSLPRGIRAPAMRLRTLPDQPVMSGKCGKIPPLRPLPPAATERGICDVCTQESKTYLEVRLWIARAIERRDSDERTSSSAKQSRLCNPKEWTPWFSARWNFFRPFPRRRRSCACVPRRAASETTCVGADPARGMNRRQIRVRPQRTDSCESASGRGCGPDSGVFVCGPGMVALSQLQIG